jgi:hypothetical protein
MQIRTSPNRTRPSKEKEHVMTSNRSRNISASRINTILIAGAVCLWSMPALAQTAPERLSDKDVKTLIEQVDEARDKFEGNLEAASSRTRR